METASAWAHYLDLLRPLRDNPDAYERMEPWAWAILEERVKAQGREVARVKRLKKVA